MITTVSIDTEKARKALILSAGSTEEAKLYENYTDEEVKDKVLEHCKRWAVTEYMAEADEHEQIILENITEKDKRIVMCDSFDSFIRLNQLLKDRRILKIG